MRSISTPCSCSPAATAPSVSFRSSIGSVSVSVRIGGGRRAMTARPLIGYGYVSPTVSLLKRSPKRLKYSSQRFNKSSIASVLVSVRIGGGRRGVTASPLVGYGYVLPTVSLLKRSPKRLKYSSQRFNKKGEEMVYVEVDPSGSDSWKLESVAQLLKEGAVGVIPTDTVYAIVCDVRSPSSVERLRRIKGIEDSKPLSILCRSFRDIDTYSMGFPRGNDHGQTNIFRAVKQCLPGPYTFILPASKQLPKQCIKHGKTTMCSWRKHVGVRMPDDAICQAILNMLDAPLICTSVKWPSKDQWILDPVIIADIYEPEGLDFVVDGGLRLADPSTIVDMTANTPTVVRLGKGLKLDWMASEEDLTVAQVS